MRIIIFLICLLSIIMGASADKADGACTLLCANFWACIGRNFATQRCQEPRGCICRKFTPHVIPGF